jgi:hypothetical protein
MAIDISKLEESPHLLDVLLQMEDVLDSLDIYVFKNWLNGVLVSGPDIHRHSLGMTLLYDYDDMPDPRAMLRLLAQGIKVSYSEAQRESTNPARATQPDGSIPTDKIWLVELTIPRRLITEMNAGSLDAYDDEVDRDDVEDAQDTGATDETGFTSDGQDEDSTSGTDDSADATGTEAPGSDDSEGPARG